MNRAPPEMLHCLHMPENLAGNGTDMTVLERQQTRFKWQQQQQQQKQSQNLLQDNYFNETHFSNLPLLPSTATQQFEGLMMNNESMIRELGNRSIKGDPSLENGWPDFENYPIPRNGFGGETIGFVSNEMVDFSISRTLSCPPVVEDKGREKLDSMVGKESFKKRKADKAQNPKVVVSEDMREKRIKGDTEEESKITEPNKNANTTTNNNNRETSGDTSKENNNSNVSGVQKPDYIHVRARRGQATDSHSLAERVRREKISERMKYLQDLVPGCNKITGKAGMLDEIINYVQSLQRQVEFLSMKLAAVNPRLDFNIENFFVKEMFPPCTNSFPTIGAMSSEMANCSAYLQFNQLQQIVSSCGLDLAINSPEMALRRSTSAPVSVPETFMDTSGFNQGQTPPTWETDLQSLYNMEFNQGRPTTFPPQSFTGTLEANNLKMEM